MEKNPLVLSAIFIISLLILVILTESHSILEIEISGEKFYLEKAITPREKAKGLMNLNSLEDNKGMIFIWKTEKERSFWMKDTLIPLDIIFLNSSGSIVSIVYSAEPCLSSECPSYSSKNTQYVIELNSGKAKHLNISEGDTIDLFRVKL